MRINGAGAAASAITDLTSQTVSPSPATIEARRIPHWFKTCSFLWPSAAVFGVDRLYL